MDRRYPRQEAVNVEIINILCSRYLTIPFLQDGALHANFPGRANQNYCDRLIAALDPSFRSL